MGIAQEVLSLDPRRASDAASARVARLVYQRLVEIGPDFRPRPGLADWQVISPTHYRFTLRGAPRFHNGTALTAHDVAASYAALLAPGGAYALRSELGAVRTVHAVDARHVDFELTAPDPFLPGRLTLGILPAQVAGGVFEPVGSGPLRVVSHQPARLVLARADGLRVELRTVPDPLTRALMLRQGALDLAQNDFPPELLRHLATQPGLRVVRAPGTGFHYLGLSCTDPVAGRAELRTALALGLDRPAIIHALLGDGARPAETVLPPGHWAAHADLQPWPHDPVRARALLARAGLAGAALTLKTSTDPQRVRIATAVAAQLAAIGLRVTLRPLEWGTFYADIQAGRFQLYTLAWVGVTQPDILRSLYHRAAVPPAGLNRGRCGDAALDDLIDTAFAGAPAPAALRAVQARAHAALPALPLWTEDQVAVLGPRVAGYDLRSDGAWDALAHITVRDARNPH